MAGILGAIASNAGDYFHFTYVVRRMLDMLHPRSSLKCIVMEGVNQKDLKSTHDIYIVDVSEYIGGDNFQLADKVIISQLKYSYANATQNWTLTELCRNEKDNSGNPKPQTSLIGELANLFKKYLEEYGETETRKLQLQIFTNRPLQGDLAIHLEKIQNELDGKTVDQLQYTLSQLAQNNNEIEEILNQFRDAAGFATKWKHLGMFIQAFNLNSFNQPNNAQQKYRAFESALQLSDEYAEDWWRRLLVFSIEIAKSEEQQEIRTLQVYNALGIRQIHFFPAPYKAPDTNHFLPVSAHSALLDKVSSLSSGFLLVHGAGGAGKSTTVYQFASTYGAGNAVPVYACWGGQPGDERYPLEIFMAQMINEIDRLYETNILATTKDESGSLKRRFREALATAAETAKRRGHKLVIAIDAIDEAAKQYEENRTKRIQIQDLFLDILFKIQLPENCLCLLSTRTENIHLLEVPTEIEMARIEVKGFDFLQAREYTLAIVPDMSDIAINLLYRHSQGIPRVIDLTLSVGVKEQVANWETHIPEFAKVPLEEAYRQALNDAVRGTDEIRSLLAVFQELRGVVQLSLLSEILNQDRKDIELILHEKLYFGLDLTQESIILFRNKNFEDFVADYVLHDSGNAKSQLVEFCIQKFKVNSYASANIVYHLYQANEFARIVEHLLLHLDLHLQRLAPFQEDFLPDIQYGLIASINTREYEKGVRLLLHAAVLARSGDVFAEALLNFSDMAVQHSYHHRLISYIDNQVFENDKPTQWLQLASSLAKLHQDPDISSQLVSDSRYNIQQRSFRYNPDGEGVRWEPDEIQNYVLYVCFCDGLLAGLTQLLEWHPEENLYPVFAEITRQYTAHSPTETIVSIIDTSPLNEAQKTHAMMGWLVAGQYNPRDLEYVLNRIDLVVRFLEDDKDRNTQLVRDTIFNLLTENVNVEIIKKLLPFWKPHQPTAHDIEYPYLGHMYEYLRYCAIKETSGIEVFIPSDYEFAQNSSSAKYQNERELEGVRYLFQIHYPVVLLHIKALQGHITLEDVSFAHDAIEHWKEDSYRYFGSCSDPKKLDRKEPVLIIVSVLVVEPANSAQIQQA